MTAILQYKETFSQKFAVQQEQSVPEKTQKVVCSNELPRSLYRIEIANKQVAGHKPFSIAKRTRKKRLGDQIYKMNFHFLNFSQLKYSRIYHNQFVSFWQKVFSPCFKFISYNPTTLKITQYISNSNKMDDPSFQYLGDKSQKK